jgi:uncharacterized protein DUF3850
MKVHTLKVVPENFDPMVEGVRPYEIRHNAHGFKPGDVVHAIEWNGDEPTGRDAVFDIVHLDIPARAFLPSGFVIFTIARRDGLPELAAPPAPPADAPDAIAEAPTKKTARKR